MDATTLMYLRVLAGLMTGAAVILVLATISERRKELALRGGGAFAEARVLRELPITHSNREYQVEFLLGGRAHRAIVRVFAPLTPGEVVRVRYDPDQPSQATVEAPSASAGTRGAWVRTAIYAAVATLAAMVLVTGTLLTL